MGKPSEDSIARENALVESASKLYPVLELDCEGKRALMLGGHEYDIDSISVKADGGTMLISDWVLEYCLKLPNGGAHLRAAEAHQLTLTKACVISYGGKPVPKTPLLEWCQQMCKATGVDGLKSGSRLLVYWWDQIHSQQASRSMAQGHTWWPSTYNSEYAQYGVWFSARVQWYDKKQAALHVTYDYNEPNEPEYGKLILPLNYVHFGDTPPAYGSQAQVLPPPWEPPHHEASAKKPAAKQEKLPSHKSSGLFHKLNAGSSAVRTATAATTHGSGKQSAGITGGQKGKRGYAHESAVMRDEAGPPHKKVALQEWQQQPSSMSSLGVSPPVKQKLSTQATQQEGQHKPSSGGQNKLVGGAITTEVGGLFCKLLEPDQGLQDSQLGREAAQHQVSINSPVSRQGQEPPGQTQPEDVPAKDIPTAVVSTGRGSKDGTILRRSNHSHQAISLLHSQEELRPTSSVQDGLARSCKTPGPTRRVCWPGATTQQIMRLLSMPAAYPLHGPICEAHVRSLKMHLTARSSEKHTEQKWY